MNAREQDRAQVKELTAEHSAQQSELYDTLLEGALQGYRMALANDVAVSDADLNDDARLIAELAHSDFTATLAALRAGLWGGTPE